MSKVKIKSHYTDNKTKGEANNKPSKTKPDESMTVREIINRTQKGLPVTGVKVPMYNETEEGIMPDLRNMDISEIYELKQRIKRKEDEIRKSLQKQQEEKQLSEREEYYRKKFGEKAEEKPQVKPDSTNNP